MPRLGPVDENLVDGVLGHRPPVRDLRGVDDLDLRRKFGQQFLRREPVGDDDVGVGQQAPAAHGDQLGVAGAAADQRDSAVQDAGDLLGDHAALQRLMDGRPDGRRPPVVAAGQHTDRQTLVLEGRRRDGGALAGHVGAHAEDLAPLGFGDDRGVHRRIVGRRDRIPGAVEISVTKLPDFQGDSAHRLDRRGGTAGDDMHIRAVGHQ